MSFLAVPLILPSDIVEVRAGDLDGDGRKELLTVSRLHHSDLPESIKLAVHSLEGDGFRLLKEVDLENRATLWDIENGLWGLDSKGVVDLMDGRRVHSSTSWLAGLGPVTPVASDVAHDLDGDGLAEVLWLGNGALHAVSVDGTLRGEIPVFSHGMLSTSSRSGGERLSAGHRAPPVVVADLDADGDKDILLLRRDKADAYITSGQIGASRKSISLPLDVDPPDSEEGESRKELSRVWFVDLDGDARVDIAWQNWVVDGSFFGSTAELGYALGTGSGFGEPRYVRIEQAVFNVEIQDFDGDGDLDFMAAGADLGLTSLAKALVIRTTDLDLHLFRMEKEGLSAEPVPLGGFGMDVEHPEHLQLEIGDMDGDGFLDLVRSSDGELAVYLGSLAGLSADPVAVHPLAPGFRLLVEPFSGQKSSIVAWEPGGREAFLLQLAP
jgi:hypothetical protein